MPDSRFVNHDSVLGSLFVNQHHRRSRLGASGIFYITGNQSLHYRKLSVGMKR